MDTSNRHFRIRSPLLFKQFIIHDGKTDALLIVTKKTASVVAAAKTKIYGDVNPLLTETVTVNSDVLNYSLATTAAPFSAVGTYPIAITLGLNPNYDVSKTDALLTIGKAILTATANNQTKVYGAANPSLTFAYSGWVNGEETIDTPPTATTTVNGTTAVGSYLGSITLSGGLDNNYIFSLVAGNFVVTKAVLIVTADNKSKYCGQTNPPLTLIYIGWVNGVETIDTPPLINTTVSETTVTGIYPSSITLSGGLDNNYSFNFITGTFTVNGITIDASASSAPVALGSPAILRAIVTSIVPGDLSGIPVVFTLDNGNGTPVISPTVTTDINGLATYSVSGLAVEVYKITAVAGSGCTNSVAYLAVYDPNGGFVTGGGWINSPLGAYVVNPALTGKANFGFNAKYRKGSTLVDGNTEFQFQTGNLNFSSSSHDDMSLIIAGAQAIYKGKGTINGVPGYSFMVSAIDGDRKTTAVSDKFRIKIWLTATGGNVYDNQLGAADNADATTALGGGSIVIHEVKKGTAANVKIVAENASLASFEVIAYPNPSNQYFTLEMKGGNNEKVQVIVYDVLGRMIKQIEDIHGQLIRFGDELPTGAYFAKISQGSNQKTVKLIKQ